VQSANVPVHVVDAILFHQQNCAQPCQYTQLEVASCAQFKIVCSTLNARKIRLAKAACKNLMKLTPWVDFTNGFQAAFKCTDAESARH